MGLFRSKKNKERHLAQRAIDNQYFKEELDFHCHELYNRLPRITKVFDEKTSGILYRIKNCMEHLELVEISFNEMIIYVDEDNNLAIGTLGEEDEK